MSDYKKYETLPLELARHVTEGVHEITKGKVNIMGRKTVNLKIIVRK